MWYVAANHQHFEWNGCVSGDGAVNLPPPITVRGPNCAQVKMSAAIRGFLTTLLKLAHPPPSSPTRRFSKPHTTFDEGRIQIGTNSSWFKFTALNSA